MSDFTLWGVVGFIMGLLSGLSLIGFLIFGSCETYSTKQAIKHNAGKYICDPSTGETKFFWNNEVNP